MPICELLDAGDCLGQFWHLHLHLHLHLHSNINAVVVLSTPSSQLDTDIPFFLTPSDWLTTTTICNESAHLTQRKQDTGCNGGVDHEANVDLVVEHFCKCIAAREEQNGHVAEEGCVNEHKDQVLAKRPNDVTSKVSIGDPRRVVDLKAPEEVPKAQTGSQYQPDNQATRQPADNNKNCEQSGGKEALVSGAVVMMVHVEPTISGIMGIHHNGVAAVDFTCQWHFAHSLSVTVYLLLVLVQPPQYAHHADADIAQTCLSHPKCATTNERDRSKNHPLVT